MQFMWWLRTMTRISEAELILPTLFLLVQFENGMTTKELIKNLTELLQPSGEDVEILSSRSDTKFSQKVRNLTSHKTLSKKGLAVEPTVRGGRMKITSKGKALVDRHRADLSTLLEFSFDDSAAELRQLTREQPVVVLDERTVTEGEMRFRTAEYRTRSRELRKAALDYYAANGRLICEVCEFDFASAYPSVGEGYIQLHHLRPVAFLEGEPLRMEDAIANVRLLCANCHQMVHREHPPIPIDILRSKLRVAYVYSCL